MGSLFLGDFNSKVGKLTYSDSVNGLHHHVWRHGMGARGFNGECLLDFVCSNDLIVFYFS
jgi:hypothetical protein